MSEQDTMQAAPAAPADRDGETQWSIAARQFRKRTTAVWGLRGVRALFYIAVFAPVLCCGLPLFWRATGGSLEFPWLARIFDRLYWENAVDRFFNLLMFVVVAWWICRLVLRFMKPDAGERAHARSVAFRWFVGAIVVLGVLQGFKTPGLYSSQPYLDYHELHERYDGGDDHLAVFTPVPFGHREQSPLGTPDRFQGPGHRSTRGTHVLGTSETGQDVLAQLLYGTRISLTVGILAVAIYVSIGLIMGGIAGYVGGKTDLLIMRLIEIIMSVPGLFLILTIIALFDERSIFMIMIAIGIVGWTGIARLVRGEFIRERGKDYVAAAKSLGLSAPRILFRHVMPNAIAPVIVSATFGVAGAIITESTLSFLGLGDPSVPSWGQMLDTGRTHQEWHMIAVPGVAIFLTVTMLNLVGDGLRDAMDPKLRK
jgi:peptide/nickel transport system permease protein